MGGLVQAAGTVWPGRDDGLYRHSVRWIRVRLEERSTRMGVTTTPAGGPTHGEVSPVSPNWLTTKLDFLVNWGRANSLWPMPFGTACCAIEFMATAAARFDLARFGMERMAF